MKKINKPGYIAIGMVLALIIGMATPAFAASKDVSKQITAYFTSGGKSISVYINGNKITPRDGNENEVYPFTVDGTTYLPVRAVASALGKTVTWDGTTASVKIDDSATATTTQNNATSKPNTDSVKQLTAYYTSGGKTISIYINETKLTPKDGNGKVVDPFTVNGTTYLPVRAIAEAFGKTVAWDGATASVKIDNVKLNMPGSIKDTNAKLTTTIDTNDERHDKLDYTFTLDKDAVGEWQFFDYYDIAKIAEQFNPNDAPHSQLTDWTGNSIYADGTMIEHHIDGLSGRDGTGFIFYNWTKGYIMDGIDKDGNVPAYGITTINGKTFMVMEWKSGYYNRVGIIECYYVFVKTSDTPVHSVNKPAEIPTPISYIQDSNTKLTTTIDSSGGKHDSLEYTFTLDKDAVGQWKEIDFVRTIEQFDSTILTRRKYIHPDIYDFYEEGKMITNYIGAKVTEERNWTKGYIIGSAGLNDAIPAYEIKHLNGKAFMFIEWKNGDYTRIGSKPYYIILEKISDTPASANTTASSDSKITVTKDANGGLHDSMDYKFALDKEAVGQWEAIDFVGTPDEFDSKDTTRRKYIWPCTYNFYDDGKMVTSSVDGATGVKVNNEHIWTKGYVVATEDTVPAYEIKQLNGKTFMFYEWKSGDYTIRGQKPSYFVLVKTSDTPAAKTTK